MKRGDYIAMEDYPYEGESEVFRGTLRELRAWLKQLPRNNRAARERIKGLRIAQEVLVPEAKEDRDAD